MSLPETIILYREEEKNIMVLNWTVTVSTQDTPPAVM